MTRICIYLSPQEISWLDRVREAGRSYPNRSVLVRSLIRELMNDDLDRASDMKAST